MFAYQLARKLTDFLGLNWFQCEVRTLAGYAACLRVLSHIWRYSRKVTKFDPERICLYGVERKFRTLSVAWCKSPSVQTKASPSKANLDRTALPRLQLMSRVGNGQTEMRLMQWHRAFQTARERVLQL